MPAHSDSGDTLVEVLVALSVLSIGIVALVTALVTNTTVTVVNRSQAQAETTLLAAAEYVKTLPAATCGLSAEVPVTTAQVPRDPAFSVTYGPSAPLAGCDVWTVPVTVEGDGFELTLDVVRRS